MEEVDKYTLLWNLPQGYGNNWDHPYWQEIGEFVIKAMIDRGFITNSTVLDIGGGDGAFGEALRKIYGTSSGYTTLDIAPNSGADIIADISEGKAVYEAGVHEPFDWIMAIDMLEHLPTERVQPALSTIRSLALTGAVFLISTRQDRGGRKIGETLHMTVRPPKWWVMELSMHWKNVDTLRVVNGEYMIVVVS